MYMHILQDVLRGVPGGDAGTRGVSYSMSATLPGFFALVDECVVGHATSAVSVCTNKKKDIILCITSSAP